MSPRQPLGEGETEPASTWLDGAVESVDRWSERAAYELFRLGIYVTMPALVVLVTLDVALRYVFNAPLEWGRDVNGLLLLMTIFCALPHAWDRAYHIRMEVFYTRLSPKGKLRANVLGSVAGIVVFGLMAVQAALFVPFMIATGETGEDLRLQIWPFMGFLSFCASVMVVRMFANPAGVEDGLRYRVNREGGENDEATGNGPRSESEAGPPDEAPS